MWLTTCALVVGLITLLWIYSKYKHQYWTARGVPVAPGTLPVVGHLTKLFKLKWVFVDEVYRNGGSKMCGYYEFFKPSLMIGDPDLVKAVLIKDFDHFVDRRNMKFIGEKDEINNHFLTNATGSHWKGIRSMLSPSFTSGRMKGMFPLVAEKADALVLYIHQSKEEDSSILLKESFGHYTLEVIASCAFGMESGSFTDQNSIFRSKVTEFFEFGVSRLMKFFLFMNFPKLFMRLNFTITQEAMYFFMDVVKESIAQREAGLHRGDFLDLMMEARQDSKNSSSKTPKYALPDITIIANSVLFILAGFDTTANTLSFVIYLLAKYPEAQKKLREEIKDIVEERGELDYQGIMEAKYLDACLSETLRLNGPVHITERECTKEYKIPGTEVVIPPKMLVSVPICSIHRDERYWPDPDIFQPERFLPENKENIKSGTYMPFGLGPRNCIGMRFAQMESKLAIAKIMLDFALTLTPGHEDLKFDPTPGIMRPSSDLRVTFTPIKSKEGL